MKPDTSLHGKINLKYIFFVLQWYTLNFWELRCCPLYFICQSETVSFFEGCSYLMNQCIIMKWFWWTVWKFNTSRAALQNTYFFLQMWKRMWNTGILEVYQYQTMCCFVHCTDLNKEWLFLLWEWQMPLNNLFPLQFDLCTILQSSEDKYENRGKNKKREKKVSICDPTAAKEGWLWGWHHLVLQNKDQQKAGLWFLCSKAKGQQLQPFISLVLLMPNNKAWPERDEETVLEGLVFFRWQLSQKMKWRDRAVLCLTENPVNTMLFLVCLWFSPWCGNWGDIIEQ